MKKILIIYDTESGATGKISEIIKKKFECGAIANVSHIADINNISSYDALIIGSPIRLGKCTPKIKRFLKKNSNTLTQVPVAFYFTCMSVIKTESYPAFPLFIDPSFDASSKLKSEMTLMEKGHTSSYYLDHFLKLIPQIEPVSIAFFKGNLILSRLKFTHKIIMNIAMMLMKEIQEGEFINPDAVVQWSENLYSNEFN